MIANRTSTREEAEDLRVLLAQRAMKVAPEGQEFTLASGRTSRLYFDSKHVTLSPEGVLPVGRLFLDQADRFNATTVGGLAAGSIPLSTAVMACAAIAGRNDLRSFYVRETPKEHGTREQVFQSFDVTSGEGCVRPGARALVVDDVLTTGKSLGIAIDALAARGVTIAAIVVLVDRGEGGAAALRAKFGVPVVAIYRASADGTLEFHDSEVFQAGPPTNSFERLIEELSAFSTRSLYAASGIANALASTARRPVPLLFVAGIAHHLARRWEGRPVDGDEAVLARTQLLPELLAVVGRVLNDPDSVAYGDLERLAEAFIRVTSPRL